MPVVYEDEILGRRCLVIIRFLVCGVVDAFVRRASLAGRWSALPSDWLRPTRSSDISFSKNPGWIAEENNDSTFSLLFESNDSAGNPTRIDLSAVSGVPEFIGSRAPLRSSCTHHFLWISLLNAKDGTSCVCFSNKIHKLALISCCMFTNGKSFASCPNGLSRNQSFIPGHQMCDVGMGLGHTPPLSTPNPRIHPPPYLTLLTYTQPPPCPTIRLILTPPIPTHPTHWIIHRYSQIFPQCDFSYLECSRKLQKND